MDKKIKLDTIFEHRVYRAGFSLGFLILMSISSFMFWNSLKIPVIENKLDIIIQRNEDFTLDIKNLENFVHNNDKRISIIESRDEQH